MKRQFAFVPFLLALTLTFFCARAEAQNPAPRFGRGVASVFTTISGPGDLWHMGPAAAIQPGPISVAFAVVKHPDGPHELLYLIIYKDPFDEDKSLGTSGQGRSNNYKVDAGQRIKSGDQSLEISYRIEYDRRTKKLLDRSVNIGGLNVKPKDGRVFLVDFSARPYKLQPLEIDLTGKAPHLRRDEDKIAEKIFGLVDELAKQPAVRRFVSAPPRALNASGELSFARKDIARAVWDSVMNVEVPAARGELGAESPVGSIPWEAERKLVVGRYKSSYMNVLDDYMAIRQADIARDLGLRAWAVDFEGGPLDLWWEVEQEGEVAVPFEVLGKPDPAAALRISLLCRQEQGRLLFWYLPGVLARRPGERGAGILKELEENGITHRSVAHQYGLQVMYGPTISTGSHIPETSGPWLWWNWEQVSFRRLSPPGPIRVEGDTTLLDLEAREGVAAEGAEPRRVRIRLQARPRRDSPSPEHRE